MAHHKQNGYKCKGCLYYTIEHSPYLHAWVETCNSPLDNVNENGECYKSKNNNDKINREKE